MLGSLSTGSAARVSIIPTTHETPSETCLAVVHSNAANGPPWPENVETQLQRRAQSNHFDHHVRSTPLRDILDSLVQPFAIGLEIQWLSAEALGKVQPALDAVDGEEVFWLVVRSIDEGAEADGTTSNHHNRRLCDILLGQRGKSI